jgi:hypothetical protein
VDWAAWIRWGLSIVAGRSLIREWLGRARCKGWGKVLALRAVAPAYDVLLFLDSDAYVRKPNVSVDMLATEVSGTRCAGTRKAMCGRLSSGVQMRRRCTPDWNGRMLSISVMTTPRACPSLSSHVPSQAAPWHIVCQAPSAQTCVAYSIRRRRHAEQVAPNALRASAG